MLGQSFSYPIFKEPVKSVSELLLPKWTIRDSASGDLNGDHRADMAVVLEYDDTVTEFRDDSTEKTGKPRVLLVLFWDSVAQQYRVNVQNNTFLLRAGEGGMVDDPYDGIVIKNGVLEIDYEFVRGNLNYKFRSKSSSLFLIGASDVEWSNSEFQSWDFNFSTGWAKHEWQYMPDSNPYHVKWKKMKSQTPIRLRDMRFTYQSEPFPSVYI